MKTTIEKVTEVYALLDGAKYSKMETADRTHLIKAMRPMKRIALDYEDFRKDVMKRMMPENAEDLARVFDEFNAMNPEERTAARNEQRFVDAFKANAEYERGVRGSLKEESEKEVELEFTPLSEEAFARLMDSNPEWTMGQAMQVEELLRDGSKG